jgi:hypothetical protein
MKLLRVGMLAVLAACAGQAVAIDELFEKRINVAYSGFQVPQDATYLKECSGCHFVYSPGMLPARSWMQMLDNTDRHFNETLALSVDAREAVRRYLVENAADRSPYSGSKVLMESLPVKITPVRVQNVPRLHASHRVMREVIAFNGRVKVRSLVNCDGCHQRAVEGDYGLRDLRVEGLPGLSLIRSPTFREN